jgi:hypothetical protein
MIDPQDTEQQKVLEIYQKVAEIRNKRSGGA